MGIENDTKVTIRGDGSGATSAARQVADAIGRTASSIADLTSKGLTGMQAGWQSVSGVLGTTMGRFTLVAGAIAGGTAVMKEGIDESVKFTKEANSLAKVLGTTATEASAWNIALGDIYQDSDALIAAIGKLNGVIAQDEEKLTSLGIRTREANGHLRAQADVFRDVTAYIGRHKEGIDRNVEGTRLFGKQWASVAPLMKLNAEAIDAARAKAEELGLTVTAEGVERVAKFRGAMNDVGDVMLALKNVIGQALMPIFTRLGEWFAATGPTAVAVLRFTMQTLATVVHGVILVFQLLWDVISAIADPIFTIGRALRAIVSGDFNAAREELTGIFTSWGNSLSGVWDRIKSDSARTWEDLKSTWGKGTLAGPTVDGAEAGASSQPKSDPNRAAAWANLLEQQKQVYAESMLEQGKFMEWGAQEESRYWAGILARQDLNKDERLAVSAKYYAAERALRKEAMGAELAEFEVRLEAARNDYAERERIAAEAAQLVRDRYGADSKEYRDALRRQLEIARDHQEKLREITRLQLETARADEEGAVADREALAELEVQLGVRTRESLLEVRREGVRARLEIELAGIDAEQAGYAKGTIEFEQYEARRAEIKRRYKALDKEIDRQKTVDKAGPVGGVLDTGAGAMGASLDALVAKGRNAGMELENIWRRAGQQMISELVTKPLVQWIAMWAKKLAMNAGFLASKNATEAGSAGVSIATEQTVGLASIGVNAARAAAGAYAAIAGIPYVGPVLAPVAAAAALAAVVSLGKSMFSAEGGMDIGNENPIIQAHAREMVLPARYADVIRGMAEGGGAGGGGGAGAVHLSALDAKSFERFLRGRQGDMLLRALAARARNKQF